MDKEGSYNDYGGVETVKHLFRKAGFAVAGPSKAAVGADLTVRFLKGWFSETIKGAPIEKVALLRLDGDMYSSTMDTIRPLYPKLAPSGYLLVDDYGHWEPCRRAIDDYFTLEQGWLPSFQWSDYTGVWMQKPRVAPVAPPSTSSS